MNRPPSASGRKGSLGQTQTAMGGRPPGTASRLTTGMTQQGTVGGAGVALSSQVMVADRPITQQGLLGMKTGGARRANRQVQDKTYYLGALRTKLTELNVEIGRMNKQITDAEEENTSYGQYEKTAETLANEIANLQGELADYNMLVDKLNIDEDIQDVQMDLEELKNLNDRESRNIEALFTQKQEREMQIRQLEIEIDQEKKMADTLVTNMDPDMRMRYMKAKDLNEHLLRQIENSQQELDSLNLKKQNLEKELAQSPIKQEAVRLYDQLHDLEMKRDLLLEETQSRGTPAEERERLLKQVKEDNLEMASMDRQTAELREKVNVVQEEIRQTDLDIEESHGERNQKYRELKQREKTMNEFLEKFEENKAGEIDKLSTLEHNIVMQLENMSRNMQRASHLPTPKELTSMKQDLQFKEVEMKKSEYTASNIGMESEKLQLDIQKVEQLETKVTTELEQLKTKISTMQEEIAVYSDVQKLKTDAEDKKERLTRDRGSLQKRRDQFKRSIQSLSNQYEGLKAQLNENETYTQLGNLERKWQHHEQNNFVMNEFIATKTMECDYRTIVGQVSDMISQYNKLLQDQLINKPAMA